MAVELVMANLHGLLAERQLPTMVGWNRLEGSPRKRDISEVLRAEVRDAIWFLTRQWQVGEFKGDDAGSPIAAAPVVHNTIADRLQKNSSGGMDMDGQTPLEALVEAQPVTFLRRNQVMSLNIRILMGRYWLRLISSLGNFKQQYADLYRIESPDPSDRQQASHCAHPAVAQSFAAASLRLPDGYKLYQHIVNGGQASAGINAPGNILSALDAAEQKYVDWFKRQFLMPDDPTFDAWNSERLEYQFKVAAPADKGEKVLEAEAYFHGHLDWYNLDVSPKADKLGASGQTHLTSGAMLPMPIMFAGMPDTRWWAFEDGKINLGKTDAATTDLGRMMFLEFSLLYGNDWYLMPLSVASGSITTVRGIAVTNVFGERFWVAPVGEGIDDDWQRWTMFTNSIKGKGREVADTALYSMSAVPKIQEGPPLETVLLMRDEMANMVWGIERIVPLPDGHSKSGREAAAELRQYLQNKITPEPSATTPVADLRYNAISSVAENWIPFVAARKLGSVDQIGLQRGAMLRFLEADTETPRRITPRTQTLRPGLDEQDQKPYFIAEEEVPRAGTQVSLAFQRTRWRFGRTCVWLGRRKQVGRGEGSSGLNFDELLSPQKHSR